jgi:hypothetical protein
MKYIFISKYLCTVVLCTALSFEAIATNDIRDDYTTDDYLKNIKIKVCSCEVGLTNFNSQSFEILPWEGLRTNIEYLWSDENRQRNNGKISLSKIIDSLNEQEEFERKISDSEDQLLDVYKYKDLLAIPGLAGRLYWKIEKLFWQGKYSKAKAGFEFLTLPENKDGFTQGASRFFLGRMAKDISIRASGFSSRHEALMNALDFLLSVHEYPTCLTYISFSYIMAAEAYSEMGYYKQALALCMVDVPSIDWRDMNYTKNYNAANYCLYIGDVTNRVLHLYESFKHGNDTTNERILEIINGDTFVSDFWNQCKNLPFNDYDKHLAFASAIEEKDFFPYEEKFCEAINHSWPEEKSLPPEIRNNRILNNNILDNQQ